VPHPIADHLYKIQAATGDSFFKLWDDWLGLAVAALSKQTDADEERYMTIMRKYGPRTEGKDHPADHFARALGEFLRTCQAESALNSSFPDYLGQIYEQESLTNRYSGQFFTPEPLCQMMVQMTVEPTQEPVSIADPACGSGRFFVAAMPLAPNARFYGIDRDLTCVHMTALNMLVRNANSVIVHGNTLSMETFGGYRTHRTALGGVIRSSCGLISKKPWQTLPARVSE
jgi:type I restriction-modification system DNA methylase subunit